MGSYSSLSTSSETFALSELTPCSKILTAKRDEQIDFSKTGSAEVEIMVNLLNQARLEALNSVDMEKKSKKVLEALTKLAINEFYTLPQEIDELPQLVTRNAYIVFLCFLFWVIVVLLFSFYLLSYSRVAYSFTGLPPT
ncbi:hypothetical protein REPUB_Repub15cG0007300 [Reevesia pubescens]